MRIVRLNAFHMFLCRGSQIGIELSCRHVALTGQRFRNDIPKSGREAHATRRKSPAISSRDTIRARLHPNAAQAERAKFASSGRCAARVVDRRAIADNHPVSRSPSKRLIVIAMLLCKLATGQFMFVSMAEGAPSSGAAAGVAQAAPCPEHQHAPASESSAGAAVTLSGESSDHSSHHSGQCKSGCKCSCTHTPASTSVADVRTSPAAVYAPRDAYIAPAVSGSRTPLFRPPI